MEKNRVYQKYTQILHPLLLAKDQHPPDNLRMPNVLSYSLLFGETLDGPFNYLRSIAILSTGNSLGVHDNLDFHLIGLWTNLFVDKRISLKNVFVNKNI